MRDYSCESVYKGLDVTALICTHLKRYFPTTFKRKLTILTETIILIQIKLIY